MKRLSLLVAAAALFATGCMARSLRSVHDVPNSNTTLVETVDSLNLLLYAQVKHVFWQCNEQGLTLTCERACEGKASDLVCPTAAMSVSHATSNLR